jgi:plastocyanin
MRSRSGLRLGAAALLTVAVIAAGCGSDDEKTDTTTTAGEESTTTSDEVPDGIVVGAGMNDPDDPTIAVLQFLPAKISVEANTPVQWEWNGTEPHSVTFLAPGQTLPDPGSDPSLFGPTPPTGPYDGSSFVNTGLQPLGPTAPEPFELTFSKAGTYSYHCVIHPQMVGEVTVVDAGGKVDTPADVANRRAEESAKWLAEGQAAKADLMAEKPASKKNDDGSTTWTVHMGASTAHTDILAFAPTPVDVKAGDTVTFLNSSGAPHTASFFGEGAEPITNPTDPRVDAPAPGPSPQALSAKGFFHTGLLPPAAPPGAGPPEAVRSFSFTVPEAGSYGYVCLLHSPSKMVGTIKAT